MKKSKKSMAIAIAMIMGCLPKSSLAAPNGKNSSANEDNSLASGKPESVGGAEKRSKKMSNSTKVGIGLTAGEIIWETVGYFFKIPTPAKGIAKAVDWMFPDSKDEFNKKLNKPKKEVNKSITTIDELREAIKNFAATKKLNTNDEEIKAYKKMLAPLYKKYDSCKRDLFCNYHDKQKMEHEGFKVVSSVYGPWMLSKGTKNDYCVYIMKSDALYSTQIKNFLEESSGHWKTLCDAAAKLDQKIVIGFGLHEDEYTFAYSKRLRGYISIGLKSDIENYISNFTNGNFSIFDFTFYDEGKGIDNLDELNKLLEK